MGRLGRKGRTEVGEETGGGDESSGVFRAPCFVIGQVEG